MYKTFAVKGQKVFDIYVDAEGIHDELIDNPVPIDSMEMFTADCFIKSFAVKTNNPNTRRTSYGLKHDAEKWGSRMRNSGLELMPYVSNGALIVAMVENGFTIKWHPSYGLNCNFNARWKK